MTCAQGTDLAAEVTDGANRFALGVGMFVAHCGALEQLVNLAIRAFGQDEVLSSATSRVSLFKRIEILRELLRQRSDLALDDINALCEDLHVTRKRRNDVAHNPVATREPNEWDDAAVLVLRHKPDGTIVTEELTRETITGFVNESQNLMLRFTRLVPEATRT